MTNQVDLRAELGLDCWSGTGAIMPRSHRHNDLEINVVERGHFLYLFGGQRIRIEAGQIALFWAAMPHQMIEFGPDTHAHWVTLPLAWFLQRALPSSLTGPVLAGKPIIQTMRPGDSALVDQWRTDLRESGSAQHSLVYLELEARLRRMALVDAPMPQTKPTRPNHKAEVMAQWIARHFTQVITVTQVAQAAHLHPNYAMNVFRGMFGVSILEYITQHRVALAQQLLLTTEQDVLSIALQAGFGSSSQFYTAFKRLCGSPPRAYRAALR